MTSEDSAQRAKRQTDDVITDPGHMLPPGTGSGRRDDAPPGAPPARRRWVMVVLGLAAIAAIAWFVRGRTTSSGKAAGGAAASASGERVVPVIATAVVKRDVPIYLEGLGNVTAFNTVTVKTQVDGRIVKIGFREGQEVKKGDLLAQIDPRPFAIALQSAEAQLARDNATLRNNQLNLDRYTTLGQQNLVAQQQVTDQKAAVATAAASAQGDQAAISNARLQLDYAHITSPIDGVTGVRLVDLGNVVHAADQTGIVVVTQLDPISVLFTLPQDNLGDVAAEMSKAPVSVEAYSRDGHTQLGTGTVLVIDNQINQATATIRLKATFDNPKRLLWPNEFVKARLHLSTKKDAVVVPAVVVQRGPQGTFAYVIGPDQKVVSRPVEVEMNQGDYSLISKGLNPGEQVVVDGQYQLRPGAKVQPKPAESGSRPAGSGSSAAGPALSASSGARRGGAPGGVGQ